MASWTVISDAVLTAGKPVKAVTLRQMRDNLTALAEGASGAPVINRQWEYVGDTYSAVMGSLASATSSAFTDAYEYGFEIDDLTMSATGTLQFQIYREADAAYSPAYLLAPISATTNSAIGFVSISACRADTISKDINARVTEAPPGLLSSSIYGSYDGLCYVGTPQKISNVKWSISSGASFTAGTIRLYRRRIL